MILKIHGDINRYYVQTLCMVFFPGSTFGENEEPGEGIPEVTVEVLRDKVDGFVSAYVSMKLNDRICEATENVSLEEEMSIATHEALAVGRAVFAAGKELLGHTPPWGILTGVRPAKVASGLILEGRGILKSKKVLRDEYFLNPQKAALAVSVASSELKLTKKLKDDTCSLYISIPFCPSRCAYCSFVSYTTPRLLSMIDDYLEALLDDLRNDPPQKSGDVAVVCVEDYLSDTMINAGFPASNVLKFILEDGSWVAVRPSGTEPKCKFYFSIVGKDKDSAMLKLQDMKSTFEAGCK